MADNSQYEFGMDWFEGNTVKSWPALVAWSNNIRFAYFRLGIGLHADNLALLDACHLNTPWDLGGYYEMWLPSVAKDWQLKTLTDQLAKVPYLKLPVSLAFEPQAEKDRKGNTVRGWPSVGDLKYVSGKLVESGHQVNIYTGQAGLDIIKASGLIDMTTTDWWMSDGFAFPLWSTEWDVAKALVFLQKKYGIQPEHVQFFQTILDHGNSPIGSGQDFDRAVSWKFDSVPTPPPPTPLPTPEVDNVTITVYSEKADLVTVSVDDENETEVGKLILLPYPPAPTPPPPPATDSKLWCTLHMQHPHPDPEVFQCFDGLMFEMTQELIKYWQACLRVVNPGISDRDFNHWWQSLTAGDRAFTNGHGWDSGDFKIANDYCGGFTAKAVTGEIVKLAGREWMEVYALDPLRLPPPPTKASDIDPTLHFEAVVATHDRDGNFRVDPFPQYNGHCPVPFLGKNGRNLIQLQYKKEGSTTEFIPGAIQVSEVVNPCMPERPDIAWWK